MPLAGGGGHITNLADAFPSPLWGGAGVGVGPAHIRCGKGCIGGGALTAAAMGCAPPPLSPPHKGEGDALRLPSSKPTHLPHPEEAPLGAVSKDAPGPAAKLFYAISSQIVVIVSMVDGSPAGLLQLTHLGASMPLAGGGCRISVVLSSHSPS